MSTAVEARTEARGVARLIWRLRLGAWCLVLVAVAFIQTPGRIATDTKLDLTVDPVGFLGRALTMWDPQGAFGQVQNQAYGYLFPMGPFFAGGDLLGVQPWVTQRLWWSVIFVVAFLGVVKMCGALGVGVGWTRIAAGLLFALSPRFLSVIGPSSIEVWPSALAPWVLMPLLIGLRRGDPRRMAALSAVAVACVGGVNAAATFAVIPLAGLWLLVAPPGPRRRSMLRWWPLFVVVGTAWWLVPLLLLGRFSPDFLDYIESADNTTFAATVFDALRGTSNWVPYVDINADAGNRLIAEPLLIANATVLLCFGMLGLLRSDLPFRRFWVLGVFLGLVLVTLGHTGAVQGLGASTFSTLLDGALAPLRNTHKFDVVIRLPLVIGFCHAVTVLTRRSGPRLEVTNIGAGVLACAAVIGATVPAWSGSVANRDSFAEVPSYWSQAAVWLDSHTQGRALLTPATPFGDYLWGKTSDEPLQALASSPWAVRNLIPLAPGGNIEMLDTVSNQFATGRGSMGFASYLRRAGIGTLVVRHDIDRRQDVVPPELVRATLATTPGMRKIAEFGPTVGGGPTLADSAGRDIFVDGGWQTSRPALEVFALGGDVAEVTRQPEDATPVLIGDTDSLLALDEAGATDGASVVMAKDADVDRRYRTTILTDGHRRQEVAFGAVNHQRSGSLTRQEPYRVDRRVHRYDDEALASWTTTPELRGAKSISSSSSAADVGAVPFIDQSAQVWAAFDGDPETGWRPDLADQGTISWIRTDFDTLTDVGRVSITLDLPVGTSRELTVTTERGDRTIRASGSNPSFVDVGRVRALVVAGRSTSATPLVVDDIAMSGVQLSRPLVLPDVPGRWASPERILLHAGPNYDDGCETFDAVARCSRRYFSEGDNGRVVDRELTLDTAGSYAPALRVAPRGGPALTSLLQEDRLVSIAASSQLTAAAAAGPLAAIDGDPLTGWVSSADDVGANLRLSWVGPRRISQLRIRTSALLAATAPGEARLTFANGSSVTAPVQDGRVRFPAVRTDSVRIQLRGGLPRYSVDFGGGTERLPLGVSEVAVPGVGGLPLVLDTKTRTYPCGTGPVVAVNGVPLETSIVASPRQLGNGDVVRARICRANRIDLINGVNRVTIAGNGAFRPVDLVLTAPGAAPWSPAGPAPLPVGSDLLVMTHNANPGWEATSGSQVLAPVVLNGWQQGWVEPAAAQAGELNRTFVPGSSYRLALGIGAVLLLALLLVVCLPADRRRSALAPSAPRGSLGPLLLMGAGVVVLAVVGGPWGIVVGSAGLLAPILAGRRRAGVAAWLALSGVAAAGIFYVVRPWAGLQPWAGEQAAPQLLVLVAVGCLATGVVDRPMSLSRKKGRSTTR